MSRFSNVALRIRTFADWYKLVFPLNRFFLYTTGDKPLRLRKINGRVWIRNADDIAVLMNLFGNDEYRLSRLPEHVPQNSVPPVLDLGAHIGGFSLLIRNRWPNAHIRAYEADPDNARLYRKNVGADADCISAAVCRSGTVQFAPKGSSGSIADHGITVPSVSIHEVLKGMPTVDLLKIDIEGSEYDIFEAITDEELARIKYLYMEIHHWKRGGDMSPILNRLKNFTIEFINPDLIFACRQQ